MTIFQNGRVFFFSLFNRSAKKRSDKQLGRISTAINTLSIINEDIALSIDLDYQRLSKIEGKLFDKRMVKDSNNSLINQLSKIVR